MSVRQWATPGRIITGVVSAAVIAAVAASMSGPQRAQTLGLTTHGDLIVATDGGAADVVIATRLPAGSAGYIMRTVSGAPAWRELSAYGALADRPACAAGREGQHYWVTDGATGLQHTLCVHHGAATFEWTAVAYDITAAGSAIARTDTSSAPDGGVLTIANGSPTWAAPASDTYPVTMLAGVEADWSGLGTSPAAATATIASSTVTIDTPAGTSCDITSGGCSTDAVRAVRSIPYYAPESWSLRARLVSVSSYGLYIAMFGVACGSTWSTSVAKYVVYIVGDSDNVVIARYAAASTTHGSASVTGIRSGEGWIRFDALGRTLTVYAAVGVAGAEPTSWGSPIGTVTMTATDPQPQRVVIFSTGSTGGSARSAVWDSVRLQAVE